MIPAPPVRLPWGPARRLTRRRRDGRTYFPDTSFLPFGRWAARVATEQHALTIVVFSDVSQIVCVCGIFFLNDTRSEGNSMLWYFVDNNAVSWLVV